MAPPSAPSQRLANARRGRSHGSCEVCSRRRTGRSRKREPPALNSSSRPAPRRPDDESGSAHGRFTRAIKRFTRAIKQRNLFQAELALRAMRTPSLFGRDWKRAHRGAPSLRWSRRIELVNRSELGRGGRQTHLVAAPTPLDAIPEHDAFVAVLVMADGAPQTPQMKRSNGLAGDVRQAARHGEPAARDGGIDEHAVAKDVEKVRHTPRRPSRHDSDEPHVAGNRKRTRTADILFLRSGFCPGSKKASPPQGSPPLADPRPSRGM